MSEAPRIGVPGLAGQPEAVRAAGGEPVVVELPEPPPGVGVALAREWISDLVQNYCTNQDLDALVVDAERPEELAGLLVAALRLDLPAVAAYRENSPFAIGLAAAGYAPLMLDAPQVAVDVAREGKPSSRRLSRTFALANALRAGLAAGAGPELLLHLAAIAREAGALGFPKMIRVITPESPPVVNLRWLREFGTAALLAHLGDKLHDVPTVTGRLKKSLPGPPETTDTEDPRLRFVRGRASGLETVSRAPEKTHEVAGDCRVFFSETAAVEEVDAGRINPGDFLVVGGCGPRGGPGLLRLDRLGDALLESGLERDVPVFTDGLAPEDAGGVWVSLTTPEAAEGGIMARLEDGDFLRMDLVEGRIRTNVGAEEFADREPAEPASELSPGYAARYAREALPALEGAGFE